MTVVNTHIRKALADERIADLRRDAVPRPESSQPAKRTRRFHRSAKPAQAATTAQPAER